MTIIDDDGLKRLCIYDFKGDPEWSAPEVVCQEVGHDMSADIYSLGITLYELSHGKTPFCEWPPLKILIAKSDREKDYVACKPTLSRTFAKIIKKCLEMDPAKRFAI